MKPALGVATICTGMLVVGCATEPDRVETLPSDAYFTMTTADPNPRELELALCHNGAAELWAGNTDAAYGAYHVEGSIAVGTVYFEGPTLPGTPFTLDLESNHATGVYGGDWQPDTQGRWMAVPFELIDCTLSST
jgi:hypothetical protein